ncbi:MAG: caspase family protein, partial [Anaerolineales bacterium]|nr:caspase family protein [Anaerolineales bacterium]
MNGVFSQGHALLIGVGADLPNTVDDAVGLTDILRDPERCAYPQAQVRQLTAASATRQHILDGLDRLAQVSTDATVIIYFSGHGYEFRSTFGKAYFLMPFGYDVNRLAETAVSAQELTAKLQAIPAQKLLLLLDC